jgi:hypothetical protein
LKNIEKIVKDGMETGRMQEPRSYFDNYNLKLDINIEMKRETIKPYKNR